MPPSQSQSTLKGGPKIRSSFFNFENTGLYKLSAFVLCVFAAVGLAACTSNGSANDGRAAAIQACLDSVQKQPTAAVAFGHVCVYSDTAGPVSPIIFEHMPGADVISDGTDRDYVKGGLDRCYKISWDSTIGDRPTRSCSMCSDEMSAPIGRFIVDKVGDDQSVNTGLGSVTATPYKAHFEANSLGTSLINAKIAVPPKDIADGGAVLHKDADGKSIAQE